jgi:hypothetical protein
MTAGEVLDVTAGRVVHLFHHTNSGGFLLLTPGGGIHEDQIAENLEIFAKRYSEMCLPSPAIDF